MTDYLVVEIRATVQLPEGWEKESEADTAKRANEVFEDVVGPRGGATVQMNHWWVTS